MRVACGDPVSYTHLMYLDGTFQEGKPEIVRNRLPVRYDPKAPQPVHWLLFLSDLLYPEDIPTVQ